MKVGGGEKMKKVTTAGLLLALAIGVSACGGGGGEKSASAPADQAANSGQVDVQKVLQSCTTCHGQDLRGGSGPGPSLEKVGSKLSKDDIKNILKNGRGSMPPGLVSDEKELEALATYLAEKK
jgi:cytochrome c551